MWAGVRKPPKEETAGRKGAVQRGATYGDLEIAGGSLSAERELVAGSLAVEIDDGGRVRSRRCAGLPCSRRSEEDS
jgi:hypothetical protein